MWALIALLAGSGVANAGTSKPAGALLGLQGPLGQRTLWIQTGVEGLASSREISGLVVPHGSRLCRLLLPTVKTTDPAYIGGSNEFQHAAFALDCGKGVTPARPEVVEGCSGGDYVDLLFVSSTHVSLNLLNDSECYGRTNSAQQLLVVPLAAMAGRVILELPETLPIEILGTAKETLAHEAVRACRVLDPELRELLEVEDCSQAMPDQWGIQRGRGEWVVIGRTSGWRTNDIEYSVSGALPAVVHAGARSALRPAAVIAGLPDAQDFVTSPDGAMALVLRPNDIQAAVVDDGRFVLGPVLAQKHPEERIISIEWATGRHVAIWEDLLERLPAPAPWRSH
jgi:hypothetical protein